MLHLHAILCLMCDPHALMLMLGRVCLQVLTGDSLNTARRICKDMGIGDTHCAIGAFRSQPPAAFIHLPISW